MHFLIWMLSGILSGWLVGVIMRGHGYGVVRDAALGLVGGIVGGWLLQRFGAIPVDSGWLGHMLVSVTGGILFVAAARLLRRIV